ncbi:Uncharacterized protein OS=Pirellula staleyi (strain ATCC 27377 / DSM 6068 / ICPB 4128) GN=Psta_1268 PE=4 SV=1 [Gemmata massiliana]|uniref:Uncharacterized protein n=1 Tax=Gemmata massiliana TaxID=1210884 RepID=A0A6P2D881_9BACT|nr:hypothetical protein [Gemmata massiliana]VTR97379.1 Uncharacterized protein OS=Pirellula staleyi (strain ATCC 27377 / DSM 6068 / ICPB 4128) GN=Psta_1268 PE=4 SV=1 [Gemmata massiliana]
MFRTAFTFAALALFAVPTAADDKKPATGCTGIVEDAKLAEDAPVNGVIVSQKAWDKLIKSWDIKNPPKVDFDKEFLIVGKTIGSRLSITTKLDENGDLKVTADATTDRLERGFGYAVKVVSKNGVKTVNGKELPKE